MTDPKRKAGFDPDRMRDQFDKLWKNAMEGLDELREVVVRASQTAKVKLDATFLRRERDRLLQELGEQVYRLVEEGKMRPLPELRDALDRIHVLVEQLAEEEAQDQAWESAQEEVDEDADDEEEEAPAPPPKKAAPRKKAPRKTTGPGNGEDDA